MSSPLLDPLLIAVLTLNFVTLGVSRLRSVITVVAAQGIVFAVLALLVNPESGVRGAVLVLGAIAVKGVIIPSLLFRALRDVTRQREVEPFVGFIPSLLLGAVGTGLAVVFAHSLPLLDEHGSSLVVPAALSTVLTGFLILTTRRKAIMLVVGYLVLENGIFAFGLLLLEAMPFLVEIGVLLDLFTGVFVMGIIIHHVNREFDSVSTEYLARLKD
jgi:hydrogenase-4 component E